MPNSTPFALEEADLEPAGKAFVRCANALLAPVLLIVLTATTSISAAQTMDASTSNQPDAALSSQGNVDAGVDDEPPRVNGLHLDAGSAEALQASSVDASVNWEAMTVTEAAAVAQREIAKRDAEKAEAEKKKAEAEKRKAEEEAAQAKNARLLSYGINVGVALAFHTRFVRKHANQQQTYSMTALPYVMLLPGYWAPRRSRAQIQACVSSWGGGSSSEAEAAATASARQDATNIYNAVERRLELMNAVAGTPLDAGIAKAIARRFVFGADLEHHRTAAENEVFAIHDNRDPHLSSDERDARKTRITHSMADRMWKPSLNPNCGGLKFGFWFGFPTEYEADYKLKLDGKVRYAKAKMDPALAFGIGFTPNTYISLLAGFTYGTMRYDREDARDVDRRSWAFTSAIGGNLDIITTLVKKLTPTGDGTK